MTRYDNKALTVPCAVFTGFEAFGGRIMYRPRIALICLLIVALAAPLSAYTIYLKDGSTLRGRIKSKTPTGVILTLVDGTDKSLTQDRLAPEDALFVFNWSEEASVFLKYCRGLTLEKLLTLRSYQSFVYERRGNHIFVDGTLNKNQVTYMIDTGAEGSLLHLWAAKKNDCQVGPMDQEIFGIGGTVRAAMSAWGPPVTASASASAATPSWGGGWPSAASRPRRPRAPRVVPREGRQWAHAGSGSGCAASRPS